MSIILRPATENDLQKILEIVNHSILHTTANYSYEIQTLEVQQKWFENKKAKNLPVVVADLDAYRQFQIHRLNKIPNIQSIKTEIPLQNIKQTTELPIW